MNFSAKLTLALAAGVALFPMTAQALPSTGTTAAAVSIKFKGTSNGSFSIQPGSNATGGGSGVSELSAAVATGETSADAFSETTKHGTSSSAKGYSTPVTFSYVSTSDVSKMTSSSDAVNFNTFQNNASNVQATTTKNTASENASNASANDIKSAANSAGDTKSAANSAGDIKSAANNAGDTKTSTEGTSFGNSNGKRSTSVATSNVAAGTTTNGTTGNGSSGGSTKTTASNVNSASSTASNVNSASNSASNVNSASNSASNVASANANSSKASSNDNTTNSNVNSQSGATTNNTLKTANASDANKTIVQYNYTGSSAGLSYIPVLGK